MTKQEKADVLERARTMDTRSIPDMLSEDAKPMALSALIARVESIGLEASAATSAGPCVGEDWRTCPACNPAGGGIPKRPTVEDVTVRKGGRHE